MTEILFSNSTVKITKPTEDKYPYLSAMFPRPKKGRRPTNINSKENKTYFTVLLFNSSSILFYLQTTLLPMRQPPVKEKSEYKRNHL